MSEQLTEHDVAGLRALAYRFLATLYLEVPDPSWLTELYEQGLLADFPVPPDQPAMAEGLALLAADCRRIATEPDGVAAGLHHDYTRLFVGPGHLPAPPWESVYRSRERLLFDWPTLQVREEYRQMGLAAARPSEPDDHIGLELLFMAILCERESQGEVEARQAQRRFLEEHLLQWVPDFCRDLAANAQTDLYRGVAHLTEGLLTREKLLFT